MCPLGRGRLSVAPLPTGLQSKHFLPAVELQVALERRLSTPVDLVLTDNRRSLISVRRDPDKYSLRVHHMFVRAEREALDAIVALAKRQRVADARRRLRQFAEDHQTLVRRKPFKRRTRVRLRGQVHDLGEIYAEIAPEVIEDPSEVTITWGRWGKRGPLTQIRMGSYSPRRRLIRIHPLLDRPDVPRWVVRFVIYHELLHHVIPTSRRRGRRIHHPPEFQRLEAAHPDYERFERWCDTRLMELMADPC